MRKYGRKCGAPLFKKVRGEWGLVPSSHDRNGESSKRMNGGGKEKSEKRRLKLESIYIGKPLHYIIKGFDGSFINSCEGNIVLEIRGNTIVEPRWKGCSTEGPNGEGI